MFWVMQVLVAGAGMANIWLATRGLWLGNWTPFDLLNLVAAAVMGYVLWSNFRNRRHRAEMLAALEARRRIFAGEVVAEFSERVDVYASFREPTRGCAQGYHARVEIGGGGHFGDDLLTCVDCGKEAYDGSWIDDIGEVRDRILGPKGVYEPIRAEDWERMAPTKRPVISR